MVETEAVASESLLGVECVEGTLLISTLDFTLWHHPGLPHSLDEISL